MKFSQDRKIRELKIILLVDLVDANGGGK